MRLSKTWYIFLKHSFLWLGLLFLCHTSIAQSFHLPYQQKREAISFKFIKNLIIIPVKINGQGPFNFVLDSGVGLVLISDFQLAESLKLDNLRNIKIVGLGGDTDLDAYISPGLTLEVGRAKATDITAAILKKDAFNLSEFVGMPIHGLLGYEFFNSFITRISYTNKNLVIYRTNTAYIPRKGYKIPITIEDHKPYLVSDMVLANGETIKAKLVIDTGAGHPVSLENNSGLPFPIPEVNIAGVLGVGLAGAINGYLGRIPALNLGKYQLKDVIGTFPNYDDVGAKVVLTGRNGNLGNQILKHFDTVFDYSRGALYIKPSAFFKEKFEHDMSGMEFFSPGPEYKRLIVSSVDPNSPADLEGIAAGDEILSINLKPIAEYSASEIDDLFRSAHNANYFLELLPKGANKTRKIIFTLKRRI